MPGIQYNNPTGSQYAQVGRGARGADAQRLKELLRANGYSGFNSGSKFGGRAANALTQFQRAQGLDATGIADDKTWEALMRKFEGTTPLGNTYNPYKGETANGQDLAGLEGKRPGAYESPYQGQIDELMKGILNRPAYQSQYQGQIDGLLNSILNREKFSYDMNADPLYQQYKDQYIAGGRSAMQDTMGQAAALTGGYGSSYAATAGNQAYQGYMQGLNDKALDLYDRAYGKYRDEGSDMRSNLGALQGLDETAYGRYRDAGSDMRDNLSAMQGLDQTAYGRYRDEVGDWESDRDYYYQRTRDDQEQANWQAEYDYTTRKWKKRPRKR